ncbi:hypothetical protein [Enterovibrio norvegicus]|uniref:hypothetical protein n=1 Tax=Enterovibrio norvegicus TaxID=188144 RepID=UPI00105656F6|nr:hypothetical protein [Enterovibrio norvegicus]
MPSSDPHNQELVYLKRNLQIAIIDDEEFPEFNSLRNAGYSPVHFKDIDSFDQLLPYPIIVCDIQGVGKNFGGTGQGAYIVSQVNELFPDKYVIVVSSKSASLKVTSMISKADKKLLRGNSDEINQALLDAVKTMGSSIERWKRVRKHLIEQKNIDLLDVWVIEQEFISSVNSRDKSKIERFIKNHADDMVKGLLINFISGLIFT